MDADRSNVNGTSIKNIKYIKKVVNFIVEEYFESPTKSVLEIIEEMRNKYDCD